MSERPKNQSPIAWKPKLVNVLILESLFVKYGQSLNVNPGRSRKITPQESQRLDPDRLVR
jgi:hypothetical protein